MRPWRDRGEIVSCIPAGGARSHSEEADAVGGEEGATIVLGRQLAPGRSRPDRTEVVGRSCGARLWEIVWGEIVSSHVQPVAGQLVWRSVHVVPPSHETCVVSVEEVGQVNVQSVEEVGADQHAISGRGGGSSASNQ